MRRLLSVGLCLAALSGAAQAQQSITYLGWSQDEAASKPTLSAIFQDFEKLNPGTKLEVIGFPWAQMQQNIVLRQRSGQKMDVVQIQERWLPGIASMDALVDLNTVFGKAWLEDQIDPGLLALGRIGDKQLGLPWTAGSIGLVANQKVLLDAGIAKMPVTVEEFAAALRQIKKSKPSAVPFANTTKNYSSMSPDFQVWLWTFGGKLFDDKGKVLVNSPEAIKALTFLSDLVKDGLVAKDVDRPDARRLFAQNDTAFYADAPLARGFARDNSGQGKGFDQWVVAAPYPVLKQGDAPLSIMWGHLLAITKSAKATSKDAPAAKFLAQVAMTDGSQLRYFQDVGLFPVTNGALAKVKDDAYVTNWSQYARTARRDETSNWPNAADLTTVIGEEVQAAYLGIKPPEKAIADMATRLDAKLADVR